MTCFCFGCDGSRLVSGDSRGTLALWQARVGSALHKRPAGHHGAITALTFLGPTTVSALDPLSVLWQALADCQTASHPLLHWLLHDAKDTLKTLLPFVSVV